MSQNELVSILKTYEINTNLLEDDKKYKDKDKKVLVFRGESSSHAEKHPYVSEVDFDEDVTDLCDDNMTNGIYFFN